MNNTGADLFSLPGSLLEAFDRKGGEQNRA